MLRVIRRTTWLVSTTVVAMGIGLAVPGMEQQGAGAADRGIAGDAPRTCTRTAKTQIAMDECAGKQLTSAERQLQSALRSEERLYDRKLVVGAENRWLAFRSAECKLEASPDEEGSIYPLVYTTCEIGITRTRLAQVERVIALAHSH